MVKPQCSNYCNFSHFYGKWLNIIIEPPHDKTNEMIWAPSEDSDQPGHPPSLIRVFAVCMKKAWVLSYPLSAQRRLWSDWADAQADLSRRWAHSHFVGFCHEAAHIAYGAEAEIEIEAYFCWRIIFLGKFVKCGRCVYLINPCSVKKCCNWWYPWWAPTTLVALLQSLGHPSSY